MTEEHLSDPDYDFVMTDYHEEEGSLEIAFAVVALIYAGVSGYGSFRQGLDILHQDLKSLGSWLSGKPASKDSQLSCKVKRKFVNRKKK